MAKMTEQEIEDKVDFMMDKIDEMSEEFSSKLTQDKPRDSRGPEIDHEALRETTRNDLRRIILKHANSKEQSETE